MKSLSIPVWPKPLIPEIKARVSSQEKKIFVLDDDPTGTQTVHDVPVFSNWQIDTIREAFQDASKLVYLLTNSRALNCSQAERIGYDIAKNIAQVAAETGTSYSLISRSDSTLRGHFPAELDALAKALERSTDAYILIPAFFEGGRQTIDDIHYVLQGNTYLPVSETPFAKDSVFGYKASNLKAWVEEKTAGRIPAAGVASISLETLRQGGPSATLTQLKETDAKVIIINASDYRDLEVAALACIEAEEAGKNFLYRTAASFVLCRAGLTKRELLKRSEFDLSSPYGGLIIVGSHVPLSTAQLERLLETTDSFALELNVPDLLEADKAALTVASALEKSQTALATGKNVVLYSSRELIQAESIEANLAISSSVSQSLVTFLKNLPLRPKFMIAKGGITSSDLATQGLGLKKARVKGQVLAGVPVWELGTETKYPKLDYIVFPGNVGQIDSLAKLVQLLS